LVFSEILANHVTEDHVQEQQVTDHIVENYNLQHHITTEDHVEDHPEGLVINTLC